MNLKDLNYLIALVVIALLPAFGAYPIFVMQVMCYALFACAFNLLLGYTGLLSFGHAAFLGVGGYMCGHTMAVLGWSPMAALSGSVLVAGLIGYVFGIISIRRSGIYFAMITMALAQMLFFYYLQADFTNGEDGIQGVPRGTMFGLDLSNDLNLYYVVLAIFAGGYWLIWRVVNSPFGRALQALRENSDRMTSLGYDVDRLKLVAFVISAALAGLAGATKALVFSSATLSDADWHMSGMVVLMTLVGGVGTLVGPAVGATIIVSLETKIGDFGRFMTDLTGIEWFRSLGASVTIIIGIVFVICVMAFRKGVVGEWLAYRNRSNLRPQTKTGQD